MIKVTWPISFTAFSKYVIFNFGSTTPIQNILNPSQTGSTSIIELSSTGLSLSPNTWYTLVVYGTTSETAGIKTSQIKIETYSGQNGGSTSNYIKYDYNMAAGFLALGSAPTSMTKCTFSTTAGGTSGLSSNTGLG